MVARKVLAGFALLALGAAIVSPVATASSRCGRKACSDEAASGISGQARGACLRQVIADCRAGVCSCTGGSPPCSCVCGDGLCGPSEDCSTCPADCGPCPPTTTTTTATTPATHVFCPTTTAPLLCVGPYNVPCGDRPCPPGQTCADAGAGMCGCVGPPAPCGTVNASMCGQGVCPTGMQCVSLYEPPACADACECR